MAINKVVYGNNVLVDLTNDTVSPENLQSGATAHSKSGALIRGTASMGGAAPCTVLLAAAFDTAINYAIGDYCIYNGGLYRFVLSHSAGAWNDSQVTQITMSDDVKNNNIVSDQKVLWRNNVVGRKISDVINIDLNLYPFSLGSISGINGNITNVNNRANSSIIYVENGFALKVKANSGYKYFISEWTLGGKFTGSREWNTESLYYLNKRNAPVLLRISVAKSNDDPLSVIEAKNAIEYAKLYLYDLSDLQQIRQNSLFDEQVVQLTFNAESGVPHRAASGYLYFDDCYIESAPNTSFNLYVDVFDELYNVIYTIKDGNGRPNIYLYKSLMPNAKYFQIYISGFRNDTGTVTPEILEEANKKIRVKKYSSYILSSLSNTNVFGNIVCAYSNTCEYDYVAYHRAVTKGFCKNIGQKIAVCDFTYRIYARFYDENFKHTIDTDWDTAFVDTSEYDYPYFRLVISRVNDADLTSSDISNIIENIDVTAEVVPSGIAGSDGQVNKNVKNIRCMTPEYRWVDDAYIKFHDYGYDFGIALYDSNKEYLFDDKYWFTYTSEMGRTDKAIRLHNVYIRFYFAKNDHTVDFTVSERINLDNLYKNGELIEIVDAIHPHSFGYQTTFGSPLYYESESKETLDTECGKITNNSTAFAMVTDLHDNDPDHYSETLEYQINAIKKLKEQGRIDFVLVGGDLTDGGFSQKSKLLDKFSAHRLAFSKIGVPVLFMRGNHDDNSYNSLVAANCIKSEEFAKRLIMNEPKNIIQSDKAYYYRDFDDINVRVIVLDFIDYPWTVEDGNLVYYAVGGNGVWRGYSNDQIHWLAGTALNTNKRIIITGHYSTHTNLMTSWEKSIEHNWNEVNSAMIAYQSRSTYSFDGQTYDFSGKTGKILAQVTGHSHSFGAFKDNGIVWSSTGSPSTDVTHRTYDNTPYETMGSRAYGDITEAHFNVFVCDNNNVHIISYGQMGDLDFTI